MRTESGAADTAVELVRERIEEAYSADMINRAEAMTDLEYLAGRQWTKEEIAARVNRPSLTFNRLPSFVNQVVNDIRQNRPAIKIVPAHDDDQDLAEIYEGLIRQIEYLSGGVRIYADAAEDAVSCGTGFLRVRTEYADDESFDQEILIEAVADPLSVYFDPSAVKPDKSDALYFVVIERVAKEEFKRRYPGRDAEDIETFDYSANSTIGWYDGENVSIAEYFEVRHRDMWLVNTGESVEPTEDRRVARAWASAGYQVRKIERPEIWRCVVSGEQILEDWERLPGKYMPIVAVCGPEVRLPHEVVRTSLIRHARDPQKLYNYWRSSSAEAIGQAPKAKFLATTKMLGRFKKQWDSANVSAAPYLLYDPDPDAPGQAPQPVPPVRPPSEMWQESQIVVDDLKAVTGIFDASLGAQGNETSGRAILARQREGDNANYHFTDALEVAIRRVGEIIVDLVPKIYDSERLIRLVREDGTEKSVAVNQAVEDEFGDYQVLNDLSRGKYHVRVATGPSYMTRRLESADSMMQFVQAIPQAAQVAADLIARNMDWPGAEEIAGRLRKMVPPELLDQDEDAMTAAGMLEGMPDAGPLNPGPQAGPAMAGGQPEPPVEPEAPSPGMQQVLLDAQFRSAQAQAEQAEARARLDRLRVEHQALVNGRLLGEQVGVRQTNGTGYDS